MIITCPQCATGYHADEAKFSPEGQTVRCRKCRHSWVQHKPEPESEQVLELTIQTVPDIDWIDPFEGELILPPVPPPTLAQHWSDARVTGGFNPERIKSFVPIVRWAALIAVGSLIAYSIANFGPDLSTVMPRLSSLQSLVSHKAEIRGVKLLNVGYKREPINGQVMLVLAGTISNDASQTMRVPKTIDVSLSDENYHELFHTAIQPGMATLGSGESASFHIPIPDVPTAKPHLKMDLQN